MDKKEPVRQAHCEQLKKIVFDSSILEEEKEMWYEFIKKEKEAEIVSILEFLEDNPKELDDITVGLPEKMNLLGRK